MNRVKLSVPLALGLALVAAPVLAHEKAAPDSGAAQRAPGNALVAVSAEADAKGRAASMPMAAIALDSARGSNMAPGPSKPARTVAPHASRITCTSLTAQVETIPS